MTEVHFTDTDAPLLDRLRAFAGMLRLQESQDLIAEAIREVERSEVFATFFWKFCPDIDAYVDAYPHLFPDIDDD